MWRAELVLSDFLLHKMFTSSELDGIVALELGAGTGTIIISTAFILTDYILSVLELAPYS